MGKEAQVALSTLSQIMAEKMEEPILNVQGWVNGQIATTVARLYSRLLRGDQVPSNLRTQ